MQEHYYYRADFIMSVGTPLLQKQEVVYTETYVIISNYPFTWGLDDSMGQRDFLEKGFFVSIRILWCCGVSSVVPNNSRIILHHHFNTMVWCQINVASTMCQKLFVGLSF